MIVNTPTRFSVHSTTRTTSLRLLALAAIATLAACGASSEGGSGVGTTAGASSGGALNDGVTFGGGDGFSSGGTSSGGFGDQDGGGTSGGVSSGGTSGGGTSSGGGSACEFDKSPLVGQPGAACGNNGDCDSGVCVEGADGKICSRKCTECCPSGFACEQWQQDDSQFICVPKMAALCRPCQHDAECAKFSDGALCVPSGDKFADPWFCGGQCKVAADCPVGYSCDEIEGENGAGKQCVRKEGACGCSDRSINEGASTSCQIANASGACKGERKCTANGLSDCNATAPSAETCDGVDNDCNGKTDDDIAPTSCEVKGADGACKGKETCLNGQATCEAPTPGPEGCDGFDNDCDGQTDEGFPDIDNDQLADCIDGDKDGDGVPNEKDCAPEDKDAASNKPEVCDGKDNDCDGQTDEAGAGGCSDFWQDLDKDGFGDSNQKLCLCKPDSGHSTKQPGDCNDGNKAVFPGNPEACDGADNDCNGKTDELWGVGKPCESGQGTCKQFGKVVCTPDGSAAQCSAQGGNGGQEVCDGADNDCNGKTDETFPVGDACTAGKGECAVTGKYMCSADAQNVTCNANIPAGSKEVCDGKDNDCDGLVDEGLTKSCSNSCGSGVQECSNGGWGSCSAPTPQCTSGACCDGCKFRPTSFQCGSKSEKTTYACSGTCGGKAQKFEHWRYCSAKSASCSGSLKAISKGTVKTCSGSQLCTSSTSSYSCKTCSGGCTSGTCQTQPEHVICLDAGYGGSEGGTVHHGVALKTVNLWLAQDLQNWLNKDTANTKGGGRWKVVMTRTSDKTVSLSTRAAICNNAKAERHLSLHINAWTAGNAYGSSTIYYKSAAKAFCQSVHNETLAHGASKSHSFYSSSSYGILKSVSAIGCMTLPAYLSTKSEAALVTSPTWRKNITLGYLNAIQKSFGYPAFTP